VGQASACLVLTIFDSAKIKRRQPEQAAEKVAFSVIPSEARNPSSIETQEKRDSSAKNMPGNDDVMSFSATCEACPTRVGVEFSVTFRSSFGAPLLNLRTLKITNVEAAGFFGLRPIYAYRTVETVASTKVILPESGGEDQSVAQELKTLQ
jgi:hypothetical protein